MCLWLAVWNVYVRLGSWSLLSIGSTYAWLLGTMCGVYRIDNGIWKYLIVHETRRLTAQTFDIVIRTSLCVRQYQYGCYG
jgi:hypothetical protein